MKPTTSPARLEANRRNALKSTGPRTAEGKAISAQNASQHGLLSREALLPDDDRGAFEAFAEGTRVQLAPVGTVEAILVDRLVGCAWRLRRIQAVEAQLFQWNRMDTDYGDDADEDVDRGVGHGYAGARDTFALLSRYEASLERSMFRALHELQRLQAARSGAALPPPQVVDLTISQGADREP